MSEHEEAEISIATWNIRMGGHSDYTEEALERGPVHPNKIVSVTDKLKRLGHTTLNIPDAYGWGRYSNEEIAEKLGMKRAWFESLNDPRLDDLGMGAMGTVIATDADVLEHEALNLGSRQGHYLELKTNEEPVSIVGAYYDDRDKEHRLEQAQASLQALEGRKRAIIAGDLNELRPLEEANVPERLRRGLIRAVQLGCALGTLTQSKEAAYYNDALSGMLSGSALRELYAAGFQNADPRQRPTMPARLAQYGIGLGIDHIFYREGELTPTGFEVRPSEGASDHNATAATFLLQEA